MSDLPVERVSVPTSPFIRTISKRYGTIFTCLASRALHIELTGDLSIDSFILALRRFTDRRG